MLVEHPTEEGHMNINIKSGLAVLAVCCAATIGLTQPAKADSFGIGYHGGGHGWHHSGYSVSLGVGPAYYGGGYYAPAYYSNAGCYYDYYGYYNCRPYYPGYYGGPYYGPVVSYGVGFYGGYRGGYRGGGGWHGGNGHWNGNGGTHSGGQSGGDHWHH
jgi:hypothetical protein